MVNRIICAHKPGKQNRNKPVVTNGSLKKTLTTLNRHDKSNVNIYVGSKEPITAEAYYRPGNDENDVFCFFLVYLLHFMAENIRVFETMSTLNVRIILYDVFGGVYGAA